MATGEGGLKVEGIPQTKIALEHVADFDIVAAGSRVTTALLPGIVQKTRRGTGALQAAWEAPSNEFINPLDYAVIQEFGSVYVSPTYAIYQTWDEQAEAVTAAFIAEILNAASEAGFDT